MLHENGQLKLDFTNSISTYTAIWSAVPGYTLHLFTFMKNLPSHIERSPLNHSQAMLLRVIRLYAATGSGQSV